MSASVHPTQEGDVLEVVPDLEEIKRLGIDKILAQALGTMYRTKPKHPTDFLGRWLLNYSQTQEYIQSLEQKEAQRDKELSQYLAMKQVQETERVAANTLAQSKLEYLEGIRQEIVQADVHEKLLSEMLVVQLYNKVKPSAVYIGMYEFPKRPIDEEEDDELAHLNMDSPKVIQYIGEYTRDQEFDATVGAQDEALRNRKKRFTVSRLTDLDFYQGKGTARKHRNYLQAVQQDLGRR